MSNFSFTDIIQELQDDFNVDWYISTDRIGGNEAEMTIVSIYNAEYSEVKPYLESFLDRCEESGLYLDRIEFDNNSHGHPFKELPPEYELEEDGSITPFTQIFKVGLIELFLKIPKPKSKRTSIQRFRDYFS